jgi:transposase-like protein
VLGSVERGIDVSHETIRRWVAVFGPMIARRLRVMRPKPHTTWHLDEMFVSIGGKRMYLWRAVDAEGEVLDCLVQSRRNKRAALRLMRKFIRKYRMVPATFVTDILPSYAAAKSRTAVTHRARERLATEQPGRELACPGATTRAKDATLPVSQVGSEIPLGTCFGL